MPAELIYQNTRIRERREKLNLTDMWRASGSTEGKEPWRWAETEQAKQFIEFILESLNLVKSEVWIAERGRHEGATWAHWQVGLAYAKYLSPEFHAWCNEVVRAHMEGHTTNLPLPAASSGLVADLFDHTCSIKSTVERIDGNVAYLRQRADKVRKEFPAHVQNAYLFTARKHFDGRCPSCAIIRILDSNGDKLPTCDFDHWYRHDKVGLSDGWPVCKDCNQQLENTDFWESKRTAFDTFQRMLELDRCPPPPLDPARDTIPLVNYTKQPSLFD